MTYGARTAFDFRRLPGPFVLQVERADRGTARAIEESIAEIAGDSRPASGHRGRARRSASPRSRAATRATSRPPIRLPAPSTQLALYDLPDDYFAQFVPRVERVTGDEVTRVMARHLDPARLTTLVVGDLT